MSMSKGGLMILSVLSIINVVINVEVNVVRSFLKQISFFNGKDSNWGIEHSKVCYHDHDEGFMCFMDMCTFTRKRKRTFTGP